MIRLPGGMVQSGFRHGALVRIIWSLLDAASLGRAISPRIFFILVDTPPIHHVYLSLPTFVKPFHPGGSVGDYRTLYLSVLPLLSSSLFFCFCFCVCVRGSSSMLLPRAILCFHPEFTQLIAQ